MNHLKRLSVIIIICVLAGLNSAASFEDLIQIHNRKLYQLPVITRSLQYIQQEYYDPSRINPNKMIEDAFFGLAQEVPEILPVFENGQITLHVGDKTTKLSLNSSYKNIRQTIPLIDNAFQFIKNNYQGDVKWDDMQYSFVNGLLKSLDPHSNMLPPQINKEFQTETEGEYGGLGISITLREKVLTIDVPFPDTPAAKAGLATDDQILEINSLPTINMPLSEAVELMRGKPGTNVTLTIKSKNEPLRKVTLTREIIEIKSVEHAMVQHNSKNYGIIKLKAFHEDTFRNLEKAMNHFKKQGGVKGLVLDLRGNPGGLLTQSTLVADYFLDKGEIVYTVGASNVPQEIAQATMQPFDSKLPMVILIDNGSASASEIVSGALKNNNRAVVIGQKSFGKGSVQTLFNLRDGSSLKLTIAQYLTPGKVSIQATGIIPDIYVTPAKINEEFFDVYEDFDMGEDKLDSHLENTALNKAEKPTYQLSYLDNQVPKDRKSIYSNQINSKEYLYQLAYKVLEEAPVTDRKAALPKLKSLIQKEQQTQNDLIEKEFSKYKIDWTPGATQSKNIGIEFSILDETGKSVTEMVAGKKYKAQIKLTNNSKEPLHQVLATIDSFNMLMKNKEFLFGKLLPGQSNSQTIDIEVPHELMTVFEKATIKILTPQTEDPLAEKKILVQFKEAGDPSFSYSYSLEDGQTSNSKGNKNGLPEPGEKVLLKVKLTNNGSNQSNKTFLNLKNNEGKYVILKKARVDLGTLKAGESKDGVLEFEVKPDFKEPDLELEFFASDDDTRYSISDKFKFDLKSPKNSTPLAGDIRVSPTIISQPATPSFKSSYNFNAKITSKEPLLDVILFAKGKKLFYKNLGQNSKQTSFSIHQKIDLEDGPNSITLQTRGVDKIWSSKTFSIVYEAPQTKLVQKQEKTQ